MMRDSLIPQLADHRTRVSCGWPHKAAVARTARRVGECWYPEHSTDRQSHNLFISPALQNPIEVLEVLAHELVHVAAGPNAGHKGAFVRIAKSIGFKAPWTSTPATPAIIERLNDLLVNLGPYPHAAIDKSTRKKQGTRLLKVVCGECGYTIRTTQQWIRSADLCTRVGNGTRELKGEGEQMEAAKIEPRRAPWRMLSLGSTVWAPFGEHGWRSGTVVQLGNNRGDNTVVHLHFETGGKGKRVASELYWRRPELEDKDKPKTHAVNA